MLDFRINMVGERRTEFEVLDETMKKDLTVNSLEEVNNHVRTSEVDEGKCTQVRDNMSLLRSSTSKSIRLQQKFRF